MLATIHFFVLQADIYKEDFMEERKDREAKHSQLEDVKERLTREIERLENTIRDLKIKQSSQLTQSCEYERLKRRGKGRSLQSYSDTLHDYHEQKELASYRHCKEVIHVCLHEL